MSKGPCIGLHRKWYYDGKQCKQFLYGGCYGNRNRFNSKSECQMLCYNRTKGKYTLCKDSGRNYLFFSILTII